MGRLRWSGTTRKGGGRRGGSLKVGGGDVEGRKGRNFCWFFLLFWGVLGGRQREQAVRGETREGKAKGRARTTYTLALPPRDGSWQLACWVE